MAKGGHSHRNTLKKDHKPFKSKHASKGLLKNQYKGKVEKSTGGSNKAIRVVSKLERKNLSKQLKEKKMLESKLVRKLFEGSSGAEKIVTIIGLTNDINVSDILSQFVNSLKENPDEPDQVFESPMVASLKLPRFKSNIKFILPDHSNLLSVLDAAKVADYVVFGLSAVEEVKEYGELILRAVIAQGVASVVGVMPNLVSAYPKKNFQDDIRLSLESFFKHFFPTEEKLYALESERECLNCIRTISQQFPKPVNWRDARGYVLADNTYWHALEGEDGYMVVEGTARGIGFSANRLVHIAGHGDFQVDRIEQISRHKNEENKGYVPDENRETLEELNPEEIEMDDDYEDFDYDQYEKGIKMEGKNYFDSSDGFGPRKIKPPKGTSEYQSKWLLDDVLEGASDVEDDDEEDMEALDEMRDEMEVEGGNTEYEPTEAGDLQSEMFVELSPEEEEEQLRQFRALEKEDKEFPDEVELSPTDSAKDKFREYRGIKSLGSCDWEWDEHDSQRPSIYSRLLRINNFRATRNKMQKDAIKEAQVTIGNKVRLYIRAPQYILANVDVAKAPFVVYSLLAHEHKLAVANFSFKSWEDYEEPIPSGEAIVVQYGFRRQVITPTFNQASNSANNVHKFERFAHLGDTCIATAIAPPLFYNAPAIFFKQTAPGAPIELVGQGTFLNCDHTRVLAERIVLTGHPVKIHKRLVTVRYMFFNAEDINWFKAVPLFTKSGRTGFIKESLGTHGYFKSTFDGRLTAQDVVAMPLYRRVWPGLSQQWTE
ncbi:CIC11C00000005740 [Sungouiella intermedia]|uniref:CIC11C00000005740 n=1 Tax=Sungouiella intermedia TaxID=45354 RepID=A0A1L0BVP3_9ASCO|nr:CIC11C00000005740 [[Candida] intermedia]